MIWPGIKLRFRALLEWTPPILAILMIGIIMVPAEFWHHPTNDAVYDGFDPNLIYVNSSGLGSANGIVNVSSGFLALEALPESQPTATLVTSPLSFRVAMDLSIIRSGENDTPLTVEIWSPEASSGLKVIFGPSPDRTITAKAVVRGSASTVLLGGQVVKRQLLGNYSISQRLHLEFTVDRPSQVIRCQLSSLTPSPPTSANPIASVTAGEAPEIFRSVRLSLTVFSTSQGGTVGVMIDNYKLTLPSQRWMAYTMDDPRALYAVASLLIAGGLFCLGQFSLATRQWLYSKTARSKETVRLSPLRIIRSARSLPWKKMALWSGEATIYTALSAILFGMGNAPFDVLSEKLWSYLASVHSVVDLYHWPLVVTSAKAWNGVPNHELPFAYNYVLTYYFAGVGWLYKLLVSGTGTLVMDTYSLEFVIKSLNALFNFADGILIYTTLTFASVKKRTATIATGLFLLNPALWFVHSIWGTTEPVTIFFILFSIWAAERQRSSLAWITLGLGALTRPQMLVPAFILAVVYLKKFSLRLNIRAFSSTVIICFILLAPFAIAIGPSLPIDYELQVYAFHVSQNANDPQLSTVSGSAYSIWPLITQFFDGAYGLQRFSVPGTTHFLGPLNYAEASELLSFGLLLGIAVLVLSRPSSIGSFEKYMPLVALGMVGFLMLKTEIVSRYFFYGLALVIASRKSLSKTAYYSIVSILSFTTFITVYASTVEAVIFAPGLSPNLNPSTNALTGFVYQLFAQDWFITLGAVANSLATVWLGVETIRNLRTRSEIQSNQPPIMARREG